MFATQDPAHACRATGDGSNGQDSGTYPGSFLSYHNDHGGDAGAMAVVKSGCCGGSS